MDTQEKTESPQPTRTIAIDASYAPEVVEFWAQKYQQAKNECEQLKRHYATQPDRNELQREQAGLKALVLQLQDENRQRADADAAAKKESSAFQERIAALELELREEHRRHADMRLAARTESDSLRLRVGELEAEKRALEERLVAAERVNTSMSQQIYKFYSQSSVIAFEEDQSRFSKINKVFPPVQHSDGMPLFQALHLKEVQLEVVHERLRSENFGSNLFCFLPRPPQSMPLRVRACAQHGYWFCPIFALNETDAFELVVEGDPNQWLYLGTYISAVMPDSEMLLSEWMTLDEQTKAAHCLRVASRDLPEGQSASWPAQLELKRRYEVGELSVPCQSLRCVGFSLRFLLGLQSIIAGLPPPPPPMRPLTADGSAGRPTGLVAPARPAGDTMSDVGSEVAVMNVLKVGE